MSKKARTIRKIQRKLRRAWNEANMQEELDEYFENLTLFGTSRKVELKKYDNLVRKGNEEMKKLHNNIFKDIIDELW